MRKRRFSIYTSNIYKNLEFSVHQPDRDLCWKTNMFDNLKLYSLVYAKYRITSDSYSLRNRENCDNFANLYLE